MRNTRQSTGVTLVGSLLACLVLAACGSETGQVADDPGPSPSSADAPVADVPEDGVLVSSGLVTVLDDGEGAELCLGGVAESYPPQCGGPKLIGWDWADHAGYFEKASGVRWGSFAVTGTYDGTDVTPTEVIPAALYDTFAPEDDGSSATTGDSAYSGRELREIQEALNDTPGMLTTGVVDQQVELGVVYDDGSLQAALDEQYGEGVVVVGSALSLVDPQTQ